MSSQSVAQQAIATTVSSIRDTFTKGDSLTDLSQEFDSTNLTLNYSGTATPAQIKDLVLAAQDASLKVPCGSILAGSSSESDDFGDVGLWLGPGDFGPGKEKEVLKVMHIDSSTAKIASVDVTANKSIQDLAQTLSTEYYCFRVEGGPRTGGSVAFVLLTHVQHGWGGLVGMGIWADD